MANNIKDGFTSKFGIIAAAAGSAIGLGNIWRFPYILGENGGGAFLLIYLLCIILVGFPVMLSEFVIGRDTRLNPYGAFKELSPGKPWFIIGILGVFAAIVILSFYSVVGGWTLEYLYQAVLNNFENKNINDFDKMFNNFISSPFRPLLWHIIFMLINFFIVIRGIEEGIEKFAKIMMPVLAIILIIMAIRSLTLPPMTENSKAVDGLIFLFKPDFSKINIGVIFNALSQAFFSLSIGMGALITYGCYIKKDDNLGSSAFIVSMSDTFIAILAGLAIFPAVFAFGFTPQAGEGLVFKVLPVIFQSMKGGYIISILFFICLFIAAITSSISLLEVFVLTLMQQRNYSRKKASIIGFLIASIVGIACALSWSVLSEVKITLPTSSGEMYEYNIFSMLEFISVKFLLPIGGLLISLFMGWVYGKERIEYELSNENTLKVWYIHFLMILIKYVAPIAILMVFLNGLGISIF